MQTKCCCCYWCCCRSCSPTALMCQWQQLKSKWFSFCVSWKKQTNDNTQKSNSEACIKNLGIYLKEKKNQMHVVLIYMGFISMIFVNKNAPHHFISFFICLRDIKHNYQRDTNSSSFFILLLTRYLISNEMPNKNTRIHTSNSIWCICVCARERCVYTLTCNVHGAKKNTPNNIGRMN